MSYQGIALVAQDVLLKDRIVACLSVENVNNHDHPQSVADLIMWKLATREGWAEAYEAAIAEEGRTTPPGADPEVISDEMIREGVVAHLEGRA